MLCPHCGFADNSAIATRCGGCGRILLVLEVRCGRAIVPDAPCHLTARLTNGTARDERVWVSFDCSTLRFQPGEIQEFSLPSGQRHDIRPETFVVAHGSHIATLRIDCHAGRFYGDFYLNVDVAPSPHLHGPVIHNSARYLLGDHTVTLNLSLPAGSSVGPEEFLPVELRSDDHVALAHKRIFKTPGHPFHRRCDRGLVLNLESGGETISYRLHGGQRHQLGRSKKLADVHLATHPDDDPTQEHYENISRVHAQVEFEPRGVLLTNKSQNGTRVTFPGDSPRVLNIEQQAELRQGTCLQISNVSLTLATFEEPYVSAGDEPAYRAFARRELRVDWTESVGETRAIRLRRHDGWRETRHLVLFQRELVLGRDPGSPIVLPLDPDIAPRHALLLYVGGMFWLEPLHQTHTVEVDGDTVPRHHLVPLRPGLLLRLGPARLSVQELSTNG